MLLGLLTSLGMFGFLSVCVSVDFLLMALWRVRIQLTYVCCAIGVVVLDNCWT